MIVLVVGLCAVPLFRNLGSDPLAIWDESRHALSALEMSQGGNPLVTRYEGRPDLWNTKPPLMIWLQTVSVLVGGPTELAVRLPAALAALATVLVLIAFATFVLERFRLGLFAALFLILCEGYSVAPHVARAGDVDALFTLFTTVYGLAYLAYLHAGPEDRRRRRWLWLFAAAFTLAIYTKAIAAFVPAPGLLVYTVVRGKLGAVLRARDFWLAVATILGLAAAWHLVREAVSPGYLAAVWNLDIAGRFLEVNDGHNYDSLFYVRNLWKQHFAPFTGLLPFAFAAGMVSRDAKVRTLQLFGLVWITVFLLVVSSARTRLWWYDAPLFPFLSLALAAGLDSICDRLFDVPWLNDRPSIKGLLIAALAVVTLAPMYVETVQAAARPRALVEYEREGAFVRRLRRDDPGLTTYSVIMETRGDAVNFYGQLDFYVEAYRALGGGGSNVTIVRDGKVAAGDTVLSCSKKVVAALRASYATRDQASADGCVLILLSPSRPAPAQ